MGSDAFIQCRVTPEMKALVRALAERDQMTESALVKQLLEVVLRTSALAPLPTLEAVEKPNRDARLYVRLDPEDLSLLAARATERGMRSATYVSLLVRSHLHGVTPLPKAELLALNGSVAELSAIGRNLNQIARLMNQGRPTVPGPDDLRAMLKVAAGLRDHFKSLLKANEQSWGRGYGNTPQ
jgi:Bacterial mobilisation protein (MobC)